MTSFDCSNLVPLNTAYATLKTRVTELIGKLHEEQKVLLQSNPLYRHYTSGSLVWALLLSAGIVYLLFFGQNAFQESVHIACLLLNLGGTSEQNPLLKTARFLLLLLLIGQARTVMSWFYSRRLEKQGKKIDKIEKTAMERLSAMESAGFIKTAMAAAVNGEPLSSGQPADLSDKIHRLRADHKRIRQSAFALHKVASALFSALYYLAGFYIIWSQKELLTGFTNPAVFLLTVFAVYTYFTIDFVICTLGGYLGKFLRPFGCLLCAAYAAFLYWLMHENFTTPVLSINGSTLVPWLNSAVLTAGTQFIAMLTGVLSADYLGMRTKWKTGFLLVMRYGENKNKDRGSVIRRCVWSAFWVVLAWYAGLPSASEDAWLLLLTPLIWWRALPLLKPFGSTLYTFFGRAKCISIAMMMFAIYLFRFLSVRPMLTEETLIYMGIGLGAYFVTGGIAYYLNERTMFFDFMHSFT